MAKTKKVKTPKVTDVTDIPMSELMGDDLRDPKHPLNRTNGKTKKQIDVERDALIARDKARSQTQHRILTGGDASRASLTDADKKAIAELESGQAQRKEIATANRIAKLKAKKAGMTEAMPLTGKAALSAIAQSATKDFVANGGTITKCNDTGATTMDRTRRARMRDKFTPAQKQKLEASRQSHNKAVAERLGKPVAKVTVDKTDRAVKRAPGKLRPDGLKEGSKLALLLDSAVNAGKGGIAMKELCKKVGWDRCSWSLKQVCKQANKKLRIDDNDRVFVS
jgi:hypothetical protein